MACSTPSIVYELASSAGSTPSPRSVAEVTGLMLTRRVCTSRGPSSRTIAPAMDELVRPGDVVYVKESLF